MTFDKKRIAAGLLALMLFTGPAGTGTLDFGLRARAEQTESGVTASEKPKTDTPAASKEEPKPEKKPSDAAEGTEPPADAGKKKKSEDATQAPSTPTAAPITPVPETPVPKTPVPGTPVPETPVPETPVPGTPVPGTPVPETPVPDNSTPVPSEGSSVAPSDTPTVTPEASVTPEPTAEGAVTPAPLTLNDLVCEKEIVSLGDLVTWSFSCQGAEHIEYSITKHTGELVASGLLEQNGVDYRPEAKGTYTIVVTAKNQAEICTLTSKVVVRDGELSVKLTSPMRSAHANRDTLAYVAQIEGGASPYSVAYGISCDGDAVHQEQTASADGGAKTLRYAPNAFGIHKLTLKVTDATGDTRRLEYSIPVAVSEPESEADWARSVRDVKLTGDYAKDIIAIAKSQLGYAESKRDFIIDAEGNRKGYTRYGDWYGADYSDWCAMFVSFCAAYAKIPSAYLPREASCREWRTKLGDLYLSVKDDYEPKPGDIVFFERDQHTVPKHVGIVTAVSEDRISTIEGNSANRVRERSYARDDAHILGYASMDKVKASATEVEVTVPPEGGKIPVDIPL